MYFKLKCRYVNNNLAEIKLVEIRNDRSYDSNQLLLQLNNLNEYGMTIIRADKELLKFLKLNKGSKLIYDKYDLDIVNKTFINQLNDYFDL